MYKDLKISLKNGKIATDLFRQDTAKPRALLPSSAHPGHITPNIIYSMAFRLIRICSTEEKCEERLTELKNDFLIPQKYNPKVIDSQFKRIRNLPGMDYIERRKKTLEKKERKSNETNRLVAPLDFNPVLPKMSGILDKHHKAMLFKKPELREVFAEPPMAAMRQPPNLRKMICRATLSQPKRADRLGRRTHKSAPGWKKCGQGSTTCCPFALPSTQTVVGQ